MSERVGFVGLGVMGRPMARLLSAKYEVHGYDVDPGRFDGLEKVIQTESVAVIAAACPVVCLSLPSSSVVEKVIRAISSR